MTAIKRCSCKYEPQDQLYGNSNRVMNLTTKGKSEAKVYRCTVCNKEH